VVKSVLFNIGHGADMAETGSGFPASRHNKAGANRNLRGGSWRPFCAWRVAVAERSWRKSRTAGEEKRRKRRKKDKKEAVQWRVGVGCSGGLKKEKMAKNLRPKPNKPKWFEIGPWPTSPSKFFTHPFNIQH